MNNLKCTQICKVKGREDKDLHLKEQGFPFFAAAKVLLNEYRVNQWILKLKNLLRGKKKDNKEVSWETAFYIFLAVLFLKVEILLKIFTMSPPAGTTIISALDYGNSCLSNFPVFTFAPLRFILHSVAKVIF